MSLRDGAETIVNQCLKIDSSESVVVVNDGLDQDLIDSLLSALERNGNDYRYIEYEEPKSQGAEPPEEVARALEESDVFIAPTLKSLSHTQAVQEACGAGARGATLPTINKKIWNEGLQADYSRVKEITETVYEILAGVDEVSIEGPGGTDLSFRVEYDSFITDPGILTEGGKFVNLPSGEVHGGVVDMNGTFVIDHFKPFATDAEGSKVEIRDSKVVAVESEAENEFERVLERVEGARNIAEFGFGTNPEAEIIGNPLQDEKVLGTIHIAFGDNAHYFPEGHPRRTLSDIHWDSVLESPTVYFDDRKVLDAGKPVFMEKFL
ncbi:MAG: aminopeptidase [Candidatus Nanohaloarchaea archaeon]